MNRSDVKIAIGLLPVAFVISVGMCAVEWVFGVTGFR